MPWTLLGWYRLDWFGYVSSGVAVLVDQGLMFLFIHGVNSSFVPLNLLLFVLSILVGSEVTHPSKVEVPISRQLSSTLDPLPNLDTEDKTFVHLTGLCLPAVFVGFCLPEVTAELDSWQELTALLRWIWVGLRLTHSLIHQSSALPHGIAAIESV